MVNQGLIYKHTQRPSSLKYNFCSFQFKDLALLYEVKRNACVDIKGPQ
jgi:hypothetical protein